jgi:predicted AAA+ superfamily ATPase
MSNKMMTNELINMPTTGGPVLENNLFYIERNVDGDLYERLKLNELCYILQSRQTGKTSLLFRICNRLSEDGIKSMRIALTEIDIQDAEKRTWYNDQMDIIKKELKLELDLKQFREDNKSLSPLRTFDKFIQDILLGNVEQPIVIFIDEIDSVLSLPFPTDDYFAFIRNCYEKRANNPKYRRLTF